MTTASDFEINAPIRHRYRKDLEGVVINNAMRDGNHMLVVEWKDGTLEKIRVIDIVPNDNVAEEEFLQLQTKVNEKLRQAGDLILEASRLAAEGGSDLHKEDEGYDSLFDTRSLVRAMDGAGWNPSSWNC